MTKHKHTPGPWKNHGRDTRGLPCSLVGGETLIARVHSMHYGDVEAETANANLISAAPDLLAALESLIVSWDDLKPGESIIVDAARAAIAKATA